jgi:hypothetical protein
VYRDGKFELFDIKQEKSLYPKEYIKSRNKSLTYMELSFGDVLKYEMNSRDIDISKKVLIPQDRSISTMCVLKEEDSFYKVYNTYHFTNDNGFKQTRLTLISYKNPIIKEEYDKRRIGKNVRKT